MKIRPHHRAVVALFVAAAGGGCSGDGNANYWEEHASAKCNDGGYSFEEDCGRICVGRGGVERYINKDCSGSSIGLTDKAD